MIEILREQLFHPLSSLAQDTPSWQLYVLLLLAVVIATTVHEFGHAWMADRLGDPLPREEGRVRLSPFAHIDPNGFLMLMVTMLIGFPLGWGKPVRTNPEKYRCGMRKGIGLVAAAGPAMNLLTAVLLAPLARFVLGGGIGRDETALWVFLTLAIVMLVNLSLFCFNLVPVHPLDGSHITASLLPESLAKPYRDFMKNYGFYVLLLLMGSGVLGKIIGPMILAIFRFLLGV
ncbi:MAG: site-2 protease family protein [Armatimonadaceae bacterium]